MNLSIDRTILSIDIGTNSIHGIIARISNSDFTILFRDKVSLRLGNSIVNNQISDDSIISATRVIEKFKYHAQSYNAEVFAVATSAVRESQNSEYFKEEIFKKTGISIDIIDGEKEAELIYLGVKHGLKPKSSSFVIIDIGGGSTELVFSYGQRTIFKSLKVGAIRLSKLFFENFYTDKTNIENCKRYISEIFDKETKGFENRIFESFIGTSGTIQQIARLIQVNNGFTPLRFLNDVSIHTEDYKKIYNEIIEASKPEDRLRISGMDSSRADIISAGTLILDEFLNRFNVTEILVSTFSLREGVIFDKYYKNIK